MLETADQDAPATFQKTSVLAQHISWLKDFFRAYKDFSDAHVDTIEILLARLYAEWNITGDLIHDAVRGLCLYKCGNERYYLEVKTPPYKQALFGEAGGK